MTTIEKLQATIDLAQKQLNKLKQQQEESTDFWKPKNHKTAYFIEICGEVSKSKSWISITDDKMIKQGNVFKNKEEAQLESDRRFARQRIKKEIYILNGNEFPEWDWTSNSEHKISITLYNNNNLMPQIWNKYKNLPSWMYLKTETLAKQLIETHKDDLILVLSE